MSTPRAETICDHSFQFYPSSPVIISQLHSPFRPTEGRGLSAPMTAAKTTSRLHVTNWLLHATSLSCDDVIKLRDVIGHVTIHCPRAISHRLPAGNSPLSPLVSEVFNLKNADLYAYTHSYRHPRRLTIRSAQSLQHAYQYQTQLTVAH